MTLGTTMRTTVEQSLEPRDDSTSITKVGNNLIWNTPSILPATYTLDSSYYSIPSPDRMIGGMEYTLVLKQDSTGSRTVSWGTAFVWQGDVPPVLSSSAGSTDVFKFYSDGTNMYGRHFFKQDPDKGF